MSNDLEPKELPTDGAERATVIKRVADALEDQEAGDAPTFSLDPDGAVSAPLPARRGS